MLAVSMPVLVYDTIRAPAPVAQWTECRPPEPKSAVRVCAGAPKPSQDGFFTPPNPSRVSCPAISVDYNYPVYFRPALPLLASLLLAACGIPPAPTGAPASTPLVVTYTLPPSPTAPPTQTPPPPTPVPTIPPVDGSTTTQLNVRAEPSTAAATLGILDPFSKVQVVARDSAGNWYQILYSAAPDGKGWVRASYVHVPAPEEIPVLGAPGSGAQAGPFGTITQQVNVRSGPGTDSDALGTLNPQDVVTLTGRNADGTWLQIAFTGGPGSLGWIAAAYVQSTEAGGLPIVGEQGQVLSTGTPTGVSPAPTATLLPARSDGDSASSPSVRVAFSPSSDGSLQFTGDVSSPDGDSEDWLQFTPYLAAISVRLDCLGSPGLSVELLQDGAPLPGWQGLECGGRSLVTLIPSRNYLLRLAASPGGAGLEYTRYTINITTIQ